MTPDTLGDGTLSRLPRSIERPAYDRTATAIGIVHFGPGAFHRVHQAWYVDRLLARDPRWGICAVSLHSAGVRDALAPQDGLYTLAIRDREARYAVLGAIRELRVAPQDAAAVLERLAAPATRVVTLTITEKGYCLGADGELDLAHADVRRDLASPQAPASAIGFLVEGLARRRAAGLAPFVAISCDNLSGNGRRLRGAVVRLAGERDPGLADWIDAEAAFPRTMVDSITPATTDALRAEVATALGLADAWPVQREAFTQWVIERHAGDGLPDWESVGATVTDDVSAFERAKLRLLNGAHSTLAYVGLLSGHETVMEAMQDRELAGFVRALMRDDVRPSLTAPRGLDLEAYIDALLDRFRNPAMRHELAQIAWDGSQKLPIRLLGTIADGLAAGRPIDRLCLPIAAWMHFVRMQARAGRRVVDPLAERLFAIGTASGNEAAADLPAFLALDGVFPPALTGDARFRIALTRGYDALARLRLPDARGVHRVLATAGQQSGR